MPTYDVEFLRTSYAVFIVEADSKEEAEAKAWQAIRDDNDPNHVNLELESIEES